ncbi:unnamed protein product [Prunus armeniaca]
MGGCPEVTDGVVEAGGNPGGRELAPGEKRGENGRNWMRVDFRQLSKARANRLAAFRFAGW